MKPVEWDDKRRKVGGWNWTVSSCTSHHESTTSSLNSLHDLYYISWSIASSSSSPQTIAQASPSITRFTMKYFVYYLAPTTEIPDWHYGYYSMELSTEELPDIRDFQPKWIYDDGDKSYIEIQGTHLWRNVE